MKGMKIIVKNRKFLVFIVLLISSAVSKGQIYKYIGLEDGLNNQKIYHIQKDRRGYMWFLTQEGVDRYDGKHIKHYTFSDDSMKLDSRIALNWLYMDQEDVLWVIGQKGRIFRYDSQHDKFELAYVHPELIRNKFQAFLDYGYLDKNDHIWLCYKDTITWYNIRTGTTQHMPKPVDGAISTIEQADGGHFFIGTGSGLFCVGIEKGELKQIPDEVVKSIVTPVHELYYHTVSKQLFVGSYKEGILIYDIGKTQKITPCYAPNNVEVNQIVALNADELLLIFAIGIRVGELAAVKPEDINGNMMHVQRTEICYVAEVDAKTGKTTNAYDIEEYPKSEAGDRYVVIPDESMWVIKRAREH